MVEKAKIPKSVAWRACPGSGAGLGPVRLQVWAPGAALEPWSLNGRDGRDGRDGPDGRDGRDGPDGSTFRNPPPPPLGGGGRGGLDGDRPGRSGDRPGRPGWPAGAQMVSFWPLQSLHFQQGL